MTQPTEPTPARLIADWYYTHPSNARPRRAGTPSLAAMRSESMARQIAERVAAWRDYRGTGPKPESVYYKNRQAFRTEAALLGRRNCDGVLIVRTVAFNAIRTPTHGFSDAAFRIERNARKRERRGRAKP